MPTIKRAVKKRLFCFMFKLCKCNVPSGVLPSVSLRPGIPECSGRCRHNLLQFPITRLPSSTYVGRFLSAKTTITVGAP